MRAKLIEEVVEAIASLELPHPVRVGIDGASASGKTRFADALVEPLEALGRHVIRASIDGFHHPPEVRYRQGEDSVQGYLEDSFNKEAVIEQVLGPLGPSGNREYKESLYDFVSSSATEAAFEQAQPDSILIFEGVMLFCDQLGDFFDFRIFVDVDEETILERAAARDIDRLGGLDTLKRKYHGRYLPGQRRYFELYQPKAKSHLVIDNRDFEAPLVLQRNHPIVQPGRD
ncbi:hypothetical protein [Pelagicoccus mobilis]|uniref:Phosphoribulokinase/uridine kinase domain-containing protein n=1 Tax=Pelagicoccus mobilis TaxID=415221 RepID=A0A934VRE0_9BACT|nr:hypothetical protein [Pelagicoccus mobilis]MBK1879292.1 hypothetical protein [Pelagicoccus mobilis]